MYYNLLFRMLELGLGRNKEQTQPEVGQLRTWIEDCTDGRKQRKQTKTQEKKKTHKNMKTKNKTKRASQQQISFLRYYNPSLGGNWFDPQTHKNEGANKELAKDPSVDAAQSMWDQNQKYLRFN